MKFVSNYLLIFLFFAMLLMPSVVFAGAEEGLLLWYQNVLPALFPYVLITNILMETNSIEWITRWTGRWIQKIFRISKPASFAVLTGYLCGYPLGAKVTGDLVCQHQITKSEGQYLLAFCNNASPSFLINYVMLSGFGKKELLLPALIILYSSTLIISLTVRFADRILYKPETPCIRDSSQQYTAIQNVSAEQGFSPLSSDLPSFIDCCIINGFSSMIKIGGYIILFTIFLEMLSALPLSPVLSCLLPLLELTSGIRFIGTLKFSEDITFLYTLSLSSFGGVCQLMQTHSMIRSSGLSIWIHALEKLATAMVTSLLTLLYLKFF